MNEPAKFIEAPFTPEQVQLLNEWQTKTGPDMPFHPFTCGQRGEPGHEYAGGDNGILIATEAGWVCPYCDYSQDWAHDFMAERWPAGILPEEVQQIRDRAARKNLRVCFIEYGRLAEKGARGADVMLACLHHRRDEMQSAGKLSVTDDLDSQQNQPGSFKEILSRVGKSGTL